MVGLGCAALLLCWSARGLQFYWDDWAVIAALGRGDFSTSWLLSSHNEHWFLLPKLVFAGLHASVGAGSVWPYVAVTLALHLLLCHLLWRLALRAGADEWLAGLATLGFALYAAGIEDILFPTPMGVIANMVLGTLTVLELTRDRPRPVVIAVLSTLNVITYSLASVFLVLSAVLMLVQRRRGLLWTLVPPSLLYALWFLLEGPRVPGQAREVGDVLLVALYWLLGVGNSLASVVPWRSPSAANLPGLQPFSAFLALAGAAVLVGILVLVARRPALRPGPVVTVFLLGTVVLVAVSSLSKVSFGLGYAMLSRYTYIGTAFLLPFLVVLLTRVVTQRPRTRAAVTVVVAGLAVANIVAWPPVAAERVGMTRDAARTLAAGQRLATSGQPLYAEMAGTPEFGFLSPEDLHRLDLSQVAGEVTRADVLSAVLAAQVRMVANDTPASRCGARGTSVEVPLESTPVTIDVPRTTTVALSLTGEDGAVSRVRATRLAPGWYDVDALVDDGVLTVRRLDGGDVLRLCGR